MFNKVVLVGNLTRDIEFRYLQNGSTAISKTAIAVNRRFKGSDGQRKEESMFINIDFFGRNAEVANQYLHKGSKVLIEGRLRQDRWTDQNGQERNSYGINVENFEMLDPNPNTQNFTSNYQSQASGYSQNAQRDGRSGYGETYNRQRQESSYNESRNANYTEQPLPEVDVDSDKYDGDENVPF